MTPEALLQSIHNVVEGGIQMKTELLHTAVEKSNSKWTEDTCRAHNSGSSPHEREVDVLRLMGNAIKQSNGRNFEYHPGYCVKKHVRNVIDKLQAPQPVLMPLLLRLRQALWASLLLFN